MNSLSLTGAAAVSLALLCSPASAASGQGSLTDLGAIINNSISFPPSSTPFIGDSVTDWFEFELPIAEFVSASMSISGPTVDQLQGHLILADWTSSVPIFPPIFAPAGPTIQEATISPSDGGEDAVVGTLSSSGDLLPAGSYFIEITGANAYGGFALAIDGNVTAVTGPDPVGAALVPEVSTWAMMLIGFLGLGYVGCRSAREPRAA
jgi:hypothetical protein